MAPTMNVAFNSFIVGMPTMNVFELVPTMNVFDPTMNVGTN